MTDSWFARGRLILRSVHNYNFSVITMVRIDAAIYSKACGYDEEYSAQFFGLLLCQVIIDREKIWFFLKQDVARDDIF